MQDEQLDDIIREAAERHQPPYNDTAWIKMEDKLDKHLPVKKDRRGFLFLLFLVLLTGSGAFIAVSYFFPMKNRSKGPVTENNSVQKSIAGSPANNAKPGTTLTLS